MACRFESDRWYQPRNIMKTEDAICEIINKAQKTAGCKGVSWRVQKFSNFVTDKTFKVVLEGTELQSPFLPQSNDPKIIAEIIDNIVSSADFREKLYKKEYEFVKEITDPNKAAEWWDSLFEKSVKKYSSINRKSSTISVKFRMLLFLIANRLYYKKLKRLNQG